jgi:hypothetical protein
MTAAVLQANAVAASGGSIASICSLLLGSDCQIEPGALELAEWIGKAADRTGGGVCAEWVMEILPLLLRAHVDTLTMAKATYLCNPFALSTLLLQSKNKPQQVQQAKAQALFEALQMGDIEVGIDAYCATV